jgi:hypothetical protein
MPQVGESMKEVNTTLETSKTGELKRGWGGRFVKGTKPLPGPGRPPRVVELTYLETLSGNLTQERWADCCCKVIDLAEAGDLKAFELLCKYVLPSPEQRMRIHQTTSTREIRVAGKTREEFTAEALRELLDEIHKRKRQPDAFVAVEKSENAGDMK